MNRVLSFVRLDFITVKPYLTFKNMLIFIGVALFMIISNKNAYIAIGMLMAFAAIIYASYPFAAGEKNNIDVLYTTLSIKRSTVVLGRYLYALILDLLAGLFAYAVSFIMLTIMQERFAFMESFLAILFLFLVFSIIQALQFPIYFKMSYTKAKFLAVLPLIVLPLAPMILLNIFGSAEWIIGLLDWFVANLLTTFLALAVIWLVIIVVSYKIALSLYAKRDF